MKNIRLIIEYNGEKYKGWQKQPSEITIQGVIENAIHKITREEVNLHGSGRTDSGVHALGQVASFNTSSAIEGDKFKYALNSVLPKDIVIRESAEVDRDFHARYSAKGKKYKYLIYNDQIRSPLHDKFSYHVPYDIDMEKVIESSKKIIGTYDFTSFTSKKASVKSKIRTIYDIKIEKNDKLIEISYEGNGFLYNMIRIISGTLIEIGRGRIKEDILDIIEAKDRNKAGVTAPPWGLYLERVFYNKNWKNI